MSADEPRYTVTPISIVQRTAKAGASALLGIFLFGWVSIGWLVRGDIKMALVGPLLGAPFFYWAWILWRKTESVRPEGNWADRPQSARFMGAAIVTGITVSVVGSLWGLQYSDGTLSSYWIYPFPLLALGLGWATYEFFRKDYVHTDAGLAALSLDEEKRRRKQASYEIRETEFLSRIYVRYPIAAGLLWLIVVQLDKGAKTGLIVVLSLMLVACAWELILILLALGLIVGLGYLIVQLPVSLAVVVGAVIIAYAIRRQRRN